MASIEVSFKDIPEFIELLENADMEINKLKKEIEELKKDRYLYNAKTGEITKVGNNCVSKDKIRELLKYLDDEGTREFWTEDVEEMLKKLLGEN